MEISIRGIFFKNNQTMHYSEKEYINNKSCCNKKKDYVMLHVLSYEDNHPGASKECILHMHPITEDTTEESMVSQYIESVKMVTSVSVLSKKLVNAKAFDSLHPGELNGIELYPSFTVTTSPLSNNDETLPDPSIVWEINRISPTFCGIFFESMVSRSLKLKGDCSDLSKCLTSFSRSTKITNETIINILERNFISERRLFRDKLRIVNFKIYMGVHPLKRDDFVSSWHFMIFTSMLHFMKKELDGETLEDALNILDYVMMNMRYIEDYYYRLKNSDFIRSLRNETNIVHGQSYKTKELHAVLDFLTDESIVDIKVYKKEMKDEWFAQLWLYEKLTGRRKHLRIVNLYTNTVYDFKY